MYSLQPFDFVCLSVWLYVPGLSVCRSLNLSVCIMLRVKIIKLNSKHVNVVAAYRPANCKKGFLESLENLVHIFDVSSKEIIILGKLNCNWFKKCKQCPIVSFEMKVIHFVIHSFRLSVCITLYLHVCLSVCLSFIMSVYLSIDQNRLFENIYMSVLVPDWCCVSP